MTSRAGSPRPVRLGAVADPRCSELVDDAATSAAAPDLLAFAERWGPRLPRPGAGATTARWELLASAGAVDLSLARALEPHADALAILAEAGAARPAAGSTWGVYAAEGPGVGLAAREVDGRWRLDGTKPWCSLAGQVTHALVTAWLGDRTRGLFAVSLRDHAVTVGDVAWVSRGLVAIPSGPVAFASVPAEPVGAPGWYITRDGFGWGGMGVAAVWYGGAVALARRLRSAGLSRTPDQLALAHLGAVDVALAGARSTLAGAAEAVDAGRATGPAGDLLALRVRAVVADAVQEVTARVARALGPAPLTQEEEHARRVADLAVYVRQHHGERDAAALGERLQAAQVDDPGHEPW